MIMLPYLVGAGIGFLISEIMKSDDKPTKASSNDKFCVYARTDDFDKAIFEFNDFADAEKFYDKLDKKGKLSYKEHLEGDSISADLYEKAKEKGTLKEDGYANLSDDSKIVELSLYQGDYMFKEKEM